MGQIILRYRLSALAWCLQAITATTPNINGVMEARAELRSGSYAAVTAAPRHEPLTDLLAVDYDNHLLSAWQRMALRGMVPPPICGMPWLADRAIGGASVQDRAASSSAFGLLDIPTSPRARASARSWTTLHVSSGTVRPSAVVGSAAG